MSESRSDNKLIKEFKLTNIALKNKITVMILVFVIVFMGIWSYSSMPKESFPEVVFPEIYVSTTYPGNSPLDIENLITRPIENEINQISEVDEITSTSVQDFSTIIVKFEADIEPWEALQDVKDAVDKAKKDLPNDLDMDPNIFDVNISEFPVMNINLSGSYTNDELKGYAEYLEEEIEKLPEISKVDIRGLLEREIKIDVDPHKMASLEISFQDIENAIRGENITLSGGNILMDGLKRTISVKSEFENVEQIENVIVKFEKQNIVYLKDIAKVSFAFADRKSFARCDQKGVVMIDVVKGSGENLIIAAQKIQKILAKSKKEVLPGNLNISLTNDQSKNTISMVNNLENSIILGIILVVLVLLFFLGTRNALFVGVAIPLSMFIGFILFDTMGVTMNMMVLFSSILSLGLLVDNGIVVVENIYRLMDEGYSPVEAAKEGVGEVALPIIASTGTTLAAFLPLAMWPGIMGEFMFYMPLGMIIILTSSLFVATIINPVLTSKYMRVGGVSPLNRNRTIRITLMLAGIGLLLFVPVGFKDIPYLPKTFTIGNLFLFSGILLALNVFVLSPASKKFQSNILPKLENYYSNLLTFALRGHNPIKFLIGTVGVLILSFMLFGAFTPNIVFFPENEPHYINIFIEKPIGTDINVTNKFTAQLEDTVSKLIKPYENVIEAIITQVGEGAADPMEGPSTGITPHKARITISFKEIEHRIAAGLKSSEILTEVRKKMSKFPGVQITVDKDANGPPMGKPINIEITGDDFETLVAISEKMKRFIEQQKIPGIEGLKKDLQLGKPELVIDIDREKARRFGVSSYRIASEFRTALFGKEVTKYKIGEDDYPIQIRLAEKYRNDITTLINQKVTFRDQSNGKISQVPISALASVRYSSTYGSVRRKDLNRAITLYSNILAGYNANKIVEKIDIALESFKMPNGYSFKFTGEQKEQAKEMAFLSRALIIAILAIFLIIISQFNSFSTPFIILTSVLFSTIGVFLGLIINNMDFIVIMTMMGIISLAGVVVNNAIVLLDYTGLVRDRRKKELGLSENERLPYNEFVACIIQGGKTRLRPVLLTAITTVFGLLPLATGMNINFFTLLSDFNPQVYFGGDSVIFWGPLSWTVIFGLTVATFMTLVIVPVMYLLNDRLAVKFSNVSNRRS